MALPDDVRRTGARSVRVVERVDDDVTVGVMPSALTSASTIGRCRRTRRPTTSSYPLTEQETGPATQWP